MSAFSLSDRRKNQKQKLIQQTLKEPKIFFIQDRVEKMKMIVEWFSFVDITQHTTSRCQWQSKTESRHFTSLPTFVHNIHEKKTHRMKREKEDRIVCSIATCFCLIFLYNLFFFFFISFSYMHNTIVCLWRMSDSLKWRTRVRVDGGMIENRDKLTRSRVRITLALTLFTFAYEIDKKKREENRKISESKRRRMRRRQRWRRQRKKNIQE